MLRADSQTARTGSSSGRPGRGHQQQMLDELARVKRQGIEPPHTDREAANRPAIRQLNNAEGHGRTITWRPAGSGCKHVPMLDHLATHHLVAVALTFCLAGFVKGVLGLGPPTLAMGLLGIVMSPAEAAALLIVPSLVTNIWQLSVGLRLEELVRPLWPMLAGTCVGTWAGAGLLPGAGAMAATATRRWPSDRCSPSCRRSAAWLSGSWPGAVCRPTASAGGSFQACSHSDSTWRSRQHHDECGQPWHDRNAA